jgi:transposase
MAVSACRWLSTSCGGLRPGIFDSRNRLSLDNSGAHTAQQMRGPERVRYVWVPPYGPELTPIERVWRELKDALTWQQFTDLAAQQASVGNWLQAYDAPTRQSLTGYADLMQAIQALCS